MLCESNGQSSRIPNWFDENAGLCVTIGLGEGAIELYWNSGLMRQRGLARKKEKKGYQWSSGGRSHTTKNLTF
jgi:hypothetical protein